MRLLVNGILWQEGRDFFIKGENIHFVNPLSQGDHITIYDSSGGSFSATSQSKMKVSKLPKRMIEELKKMTTKKEVIDNVIPYFLMVEQGEKGFSTPYIRKKLEKDKMMKYNFID